MALMTFQEFKERFHIRLNEQQLAAVQSVDKPTLLLAVPGSGKTTVLVTRLGYMIYCCGICPEQILTVTYTVAATRDMQARFASMFGEELASRLEFRTINGICARIINYYGNLVGKKPFELVTDEGFKTKLLSDIYRECEHDYPTESDLKGLSTSITYIKNMQCTKEEIQKLGEEAGIDSLQKIYDTYCKQMRERGCMDFDDQMVYALTMLTHYPPVLEYFQEMFPYICVDEAQDTSKIQHRIIAELAKRYEHLFMVGDEDQSIYGFRAAYPEALLSFEKHHRDAQVLVMEENFRSNAQIVSAADRFIQKNEFRHKKTMRASRAAGTAVREIELTGRRAQYSYLLKVAQNCMSETAVLYRDNESILPVVDLLERNGIDYRIRNADLTFFSHRIILDIESIIRFAQNPLDTELFLKIYYKIGTYMSKVAALEACQLSAQKDLPVLEAALRFGKIPAGTQKAVRAIQLHLENLLKESAAQAVGRIVKMMGYSDYLERAHINDGKLRILEALAANESSAERLLERLRELSEVIREKKSSPDCKLILSTIHSSKGLEYDTVYLLDAIDGIFPENIVENRNQASMEERKIYEEQRRLYYVAVTRAKNNLNIFSIKDKATFTWELLGKEKIKAAGFESAGSGISSGYGRVGLGQSGTGKGGLGMGGFGRSGAGANGFRKFGQLSLKSGHSGKNANSGSHTNLSKPKSTKRTVTESEYHDKLEEILTTGCIKHKTFGEGKLISADGDILEIRFKNKTAKCKLKLMMENGIIEW